MTIKQSEFRETVNRSAKESNKIKTKQQQLQKMPMK